MKIALYSTLILEYGGGLEKYLIELASYLGKDARIEQIDIITMDDSFANRMTDLQSLFYFRKIDKRLNYRENIDDILHKLGDSASYIKCHSLKELRSTLQQYDVIYTKNELIETSILRFYLGYDNLPPVILGGHTPLEYVNATSSYAKVHNFLYGGKLYRLLAGKAAGYHAINSHEESLYKQHFPSEKVSLIYNPFNMDSYVATSTNSTYPVHTNPNSTNIMWAARLTEQKGVDELSRLVSMMDDGSDITWHIFGDGELKPVVEKLADTHTNVRYYGHVDQKYMSHIFSQCDVFISTSKWEGYPYSLLEAMSHRLHIIAFDIPGVSDVIRSYSAGASASSTENMAEILRSTINQNQPVKTFDTEQFDESIIYQKLLDLFRNTQHIYGK